MLPKVATILLTNECPLQCRYCFLDVISGTNSCIEKLDMDEAQISVIIEEAMLTLQQGQLLRVTFTGGEPFLRWKLIKGIIEKYPQVQYEFNTSGVPLTKDILYFLSKYNVRFNLSVDGGQKMAKYLRPFKNDKDYNGDYYKTFKKIAPTLLYYFPKTAWKTIVSKYNVHKLPEIYSDAMEIGFRRFHWTPDLREISADRLRENHDEKNFLTKWDDEQYYDLFIAYSQMLEIMLSCLKKGIIPPIDSHLARYIKHYILDDKPNDFRDIISCGVLHGRENTTVFGEGKTSMCCAGKLGITIEEFNHQMYNEFLSNRGRCPNDSDCGHYEYCLKYSCLQDNIEDNGDRFLTPAKLYCKQNKMLLAAIKVFMDEISKPENVNLYSFQKMLQIIKKEGF